MDVSEWQNRLERYFTVNGVIGGHLLEIIDKEKKYGEYVTTKFHGQRVLMDSFFSFFIETIRIVNSEIKKKGWPTNYPQYGPTILFYVTLFRSFRAAENLFTCGYPLDGYALVRDIKDRAIFLGAIVNGITSLSKIFGYGGVKVLTEETYKELKDKRKKEEFRVLNLMIRTKSGLGEPVRFELQKWENFFREEVHGSKLTYFTEGGKWLKGEIPLSIGPVPMERSCAIYMNRASEIGWLIVRLFPYLQLEAHSFGEEWADKWNVLDDSFRIMIKALEKLGKKIASAFINFVDIKFPFGPATSYHEKE